MTGSFSGSLLPEEAGVPSEVAVPQAARVRARSDAANALNTLFFFMFFPLFYLTFINFFNECVTRPLNCKYDQDDDDG